MFTEVAVTKYWQEHLAYNDSYTFCKLMAMSMTNREGAYMSHWHSPSLAWNL